MSLRRAWLLLLLALVCCADDPLTQIVVVVDSDYADFTRVDIEVGGFEKPATISIEDLADKKLPRRLTLVHDGGPLGPISVTVSAWVNSFDQPVLREPRTGIQFVNGKTRMLKVDLYWQCIMMKPCDQACVEGECVSSRAATKLLPWDASFEPLDMQYSLGSGMHVVKADGGDGFVALGPDGSSSGGDAEPPQAGSQSGGNGGSSGTTESDANVDGAVDAGPPEAVPVFTYMPSNFDPGQVQASAADRPDVVLNCPLPQFDSTSLEFTAWCGPKPLVSTIKQADGSDAVLLVMNTFSLDQASTLQLSGELPVILAVFGDAQVFGTIDASARGAQPGAGAASECGTSIGSTGASGTSTMNAAGGGSGGGFGSAGARGGAGGGASARVDGGTSGGEATLNPLRGGCPGGRGGDGESLGGSGGAGGGAVQISAAGGLQLIGSVLAGGGGGQAGSAARDGGGGGGSGGAILLEGANVLIDSAAVIAANGGGGGGGQPSAVVEATSTGGSDGVAGVAPAAGGSGSNSGGDGGVGAAGFAEAVEGANGMPALQSAGGGGGGGGGAGRIHVNRAGTCALRGIFSPAAAVECPSCAQPICPPATQMPMMMSDCSVRSRSGALYYVCTGPLGFDDARASCQMLANDLVHVDSQAENDWLASQLPIGSSSWTWIGASDEMSEGDWRWVDDDVRFWYGSASGFKIGGAFSAWDMGSEPNDSGNCARLEDGIWYDQDCALPGAYICE